MINSWLGHIQINIAPQNVAFYKEIFKVLGWTVLYEDDTAAGFGDKNNTSLWFMPSLKNGTNDYDNPGMNHVALAVAAQTDVDAMVTYLGEHDVEALFDTPRHRPDFCESPDQTYYQVMFESPDRILFEVVYTGPIVK